MKLFGLLTLTAVAAEEDECSPKNGKVRKSWTQQNTIFLASITQFFGQFCGFFFYFFWENLGFGNVFGSSL